MSDIDPSTVNDKCPACGDQLFWYPAINEQGWKCCSCGHQPGEPAGYSPHRDKALIEIKVSGLLHDVADANLISISNGSHGEGMTAIVARRCVDLDRYDQTTILRLIFEADASHCDYWHKVGSGVRTGEDPRRRCPGGRLSTRSTGSAEGWKYSCAEKDCGHCRSSSEVPF